jgi:hypothetical protein
MKGVAGSILIILLCLSLNSYAQNSRETAGEQKVRGKADPRYHHEAVKKNNRRKNKKPENSYKRYYDVKVREFEDRKDAVAREEKKKAREMKKPQYSDPSYFGHKKKPKKRPPGKKKYCKECGLIH